MRRYRIGAVLLGLIVTACGEAPPAAPPSTSPGSYACFLGRQSCIQYDLTTPNTITDLALSCTSGDNNRWQMTACPVVGNRGRCFSNDVSGSSVVVVYSTSEEFLNVIRSSCTRSGGTWVPP